jgi:site-specific recombinase
MLEILERINAESSDIGLMVELFATLRPKRAHDGATATANVRTLCQLLKGNPAHALALHHYARKLLAARRHASLYTEIGVLSNDGFFTELRTRIAYRILPPALGNDYLSEALDQIVYKRTDYLWIAAVPAEDWLACSTWCSTPRRGNGNLMLPGLLDAIRTLSYRVCAIGLEPRLTNFHTEMETYESPFMVQNFEVNAYLDAYQRKLAGEEVALEDTRHLLVMLDQCDAVIAKIRKKALSQGTSIALTYLLVSLTQSLDRMRKLLFLVDVQHHGARRTPPWRWRWNWSRRTTTNTW